MDSTLVWYAAYGSNLWPERFRYYLEGGTAPGSTTPSPGARDATPARATEAGTCSHERFFAGEASRWHGGGVAFLATEPGDHQTLLRLYLLTLEQFEDVYAQENRRTPSVEAPAAVDVDAVVAAGHLDLLDGWYGRLLHLGTHADGHEILTFTAESPPPRNPPHDSYLQMINNGEASLAN